MTELDLDALERRHAADAGLCCDCLDDDSGQICDEAALIAELRACRAERDRRVEFDPHEIRLVNTAARAHARAERAEARIEALEAYRDLLVATIARVEAYVAELERRGYELFVAELQAALRGKGELSVPRPKWKAVAELQAALRGDDA